MSVTVVCNLSDGVILGVDSALSIFGSSGVSKVFENSEKLFKLGEKMGVAVYGLAGFQGRSVGNYVREFERSTPDLNDLPLSEVAERMRVFFFGVYRETAEAIYGIPLEQIQDPLSSVGFTIAGYSPHNFFAECWSVIVPEMTAPNSASCIYAPGSFGLAWFAQGDPIGRYFNGVVQDFIYDVVNYVETLIARPLTPQEIADLVAKREPYRYRPMTDSMPLQVGVDYVKFLVDFVIGHHRFSEGASHRRGKDKDWANQL